MKRFIALLLALSLLVTPVARAAEDDKAFIDRAKHAVGILYSQDEQGGMNMHCTATAYQQTPKVDGSFEYLFLTAAHCIGSDRADKEKSADPRNIPFFITFDEDKDAKKFWPATVKWVGYQSRGEDFSVLEVDTKENWPTVPIGDEHAVKDGADYWNIASPLGLGIQIQEGKIASKNLDRPLVAGDINWSHTLVLQQVGVNGGSSGSALISKDTHAIVGTLVGSVAGSTIIGIPISRFTAVQKAIDAKKYKYYVPEVNVGPDGEPIEGK